MDQVIYFFNHLFSTADWPPRWHCGRWTDFHGWLYICSDLAIWSAYFAMPMIIVLYITRRKNVRFHPIYFLFAAFILACGITHLLDAITFWYPMYRLNALSRFVAGCISWITVFYLIKILPTAFSLKSAEELEAEVERNRKLTRELEGVNAQLSQKVTELEKANKELEQFAYISSHDLQEPLRKMQTFMGFLAGNRNNDEKFSRYYSKLMDSSSRMKTLITALLSYSTISHTGFKFEPVDLNTVIDDIKADFELLIAEKNVTITTGPLPRIDGIRIQLGQLFTNLVHNAIKFSVQQPVVTISSVALSPADVAKDPGLRPGVAYVAITVQDNGIGFNQEFADSIFKIFNRLHNREDYEGTGIGLAICKKIVDNHDGIINAVSEKGKGARFIVTLPVRHEVATL